MNFRSHLLGTCGVTFVVRDVPVHDAPQPLDRIQVRAIRRNEMQPDPAFGPRQPVPHELGVMIARVVEKHMDERQHRVERLDRFKEPDRRGGVDGFNLDHSGTARHQIKCAVNIDALTSARLFDRQLVLLRRPAADRLGRMGRMHGVREQHGLVVGQGIHEVFIGRDEGLLLLFVEWYSVLAGASGTMVTRLLTWAGASSLGVVLGTFAALGLLFQISHFAEHAIQFAVWVLGDLSHLFMSCDLHQPRASAAAATRSRKIG